MATVLDRQVEAFRQSVLEVRPSVALSADLETERAALVEQLQDLIDVGTNLAQHLVRRVTGARSAGNVSKDRASRLADKTRGMMGLMVELQRAWGPPLFAIAQLREQGEFNDAVVDLRGLIAELQGDAAGVTPPPPPSDAERERMREEFVRLAEVHRPPQSWFEEDFTGLADPGNP